MLNYRSGGEQLGEVDPLQSFRKMVGAAAVQQKRSLVYGGMQVLSKNDHETMIT